MPTTYAFDELTYSSLDQENIARGHTAYYLKWADEALQEAGRAYYDKGVTTRDIALGLAPGTSELERGTAKAGASSCPSATSK